jgi:hypothetical protein
MSELAPIAPVPPMVRDMDLAANRPPSSTALAGETITLQYDDGDLATLRFSEARVAWEIQGGSGSGGGGSSGSGSGSGSGEDAYDAVELRPQVFFVTIASPAASAGFNHVIDQAAGRAVTVFNALEFGDGGARLRRFVRTARIGGHAGAYDPIPESRELIGRRAFCYYSDEAALEHVYVNSRAIVWQWLRLPDDPRFDPLRTEVGIEAVSMRKVQDDLFLLTLHDGGPVGLTLLMDFAQKQNVGWLFGQGAGGMVDRPCGAKIVPLNMLTYPQGFSPG